MSERSAVESGIESPYSWLRLGISILISSIGGVGMWSVVVAIPAVQAEFGSARGGASLAYTAVMIGFAAGGVLMGHLMDKRGIVAPLMLGASSLGLGYVLAGFAPNLFVFAATHGVLIGALGSSASFGPLMSDLSLFFSKRRGLAVSLCASGNYLAGAVWPRVVQYGIDTVGWRYTHIAIGVFCIMTLVPLGLMLRRRPPSAAMQAQNSKTQRGGDLKLSPNVLQALLFIAGVGCCVAMAMPQVHLVAYCGDLGYGAARGAEMLSMMLALGIVSRIASGFIADRFGGLFSLGLGALMQGTALTLFLFFDSLNSLYAIAALFGLFQGGIVPSYAIIVREYFEPREAGTRVGLVFMATYFGMAFGGWLSGAIFDWTGSYAFAFLNGVGFNLINLVIVAFLITRGGGALTVYRMRTRHAA